MKSFSYDSNVLLWGSASPQCLAALWSLAKDIWGISSYEVLLLQSMHIPPNPETEWMNLGWGLFWSSGTNKHWWVSGQKAEAKKPSTTMQTVPRVDQSRDRQEK